MIRRVLAFSDAMNVALVNGIVVLVSALVSGIVLVRVNTVHRDVKRNGTTSDVVLDVAEKTLRVVNGKEH